MSNPVLEYSFENDLGHDIKVHIEPWNEEFIVPDGSIFLMSFSYLVTGLMKTYLDSKYFTIWLWDNCAVTNVSIDGKDYPGESS